MTTLPFCLPTEISPETFLNDYWQKKPLLIKNGLPQLKTMFEPSDILELATFEEVTARLITQVGKNHQQWTLQNSPFTQKDFEKLPELWTVLVQNMEQWSPELANLWHAFDFIPQWQRDDIMVSYAPKGGSVGRHYDEYDVFLAQGYGSRRWQLGKICDESTEFMVGQPIRLMDEMGEIFFDNVLQAGDVLYVPPRLSHYGVALEDCLTFSFGFRRPNLMQILDNLTDVATQNDPMCVPLLLNQSPQSAGKLEQSTINHIKQNLLDLLNSPQGETLINQAVLETVSKRQYDIMVSEEPMEFDDLVESLESGATLSQDMASRIVYQVLPNGEKVVYINGERLVSLEESSYENNAHLAENAFSKSALQLLAYLADGEVISLTDIEKAGVELETIADWVDNAWVMLNDG